MKNKIAVYDPHFLDTIRISSFFDELWYRENYSERVASEVDPLLHYLEEGASAGFDPSPNFSTKGYLSTYADVERAGMNPLVHFVKSGQGEGRSPRGIISKESCVRAPMPRFGSVEYGPVAKWLTFDQTTTNSYCIDRRVCVHLHLYHLDMLDEFISLLSNIPCKFTLLVSVCDPKHPDIATKVSRCLPRVARTVVRVMPNRGRDVASWVVGFSDEILRHDLFCHLHSKSSDYNKEYSGWRKFLLHNTIGSKSVVEQILDEFVADSSTGVVAPPYFSALPGQPRWGANRGLVERLVERMGFSLDKAECADFPAGSFFWARVDVLKPLFDCALSYKEFEDEAGQIDGTLGHAIERVLGILPGLCGKRFKMLGVDVAYNLINYWDERRVEKLKTLIPTNRQEAPPDAFDTVVSTDRKANVAVFVCVTGGFDEFMKYPITESSVDYYFITDGDFISNSEQERIAPFRWLPARYSDPNPRRTARFVKTHPHFYLNGYDYAVWIDANIVPLCGVMPLVNSLQASGADVGVIAHPIRSSWAEEAQECARIGADDTAVLEEQVAEYRARGVSEEGLIETNVMVANLREPEVIRFYSHWWAEMCRHSLRDQVSINAALNRCNLRIHYLMNRGLSVRDEKGFLIFSHDVKRSRQLILDYVLTRDF